MISKSLLLLPINTSLGTLCGLEFEDLKDHRDLGDC